MASSTRRKIARSAVRRVKRAKKTHGRRSHKTRINKMKGGGDRYKRNIYSCHKGDTANKDNFFGIIVVTFDTEDKKNTPIRWTFVKFKKIDESDQATQATQATFKEFLTALIKFPPPKVSKILIRSEILYR